MEKQENLQRMVMYRWHWTRTYYCQ